MAGPQFFTPPRVTPSRPKKRFSLQEANKALPYVTRIVQDLVSTHRTAANLEARLEKQGTSKDRNGAEQELSRSKDRLRGLVEELAAVGVELKDPQTGLIDFVGRHKRHDVYLCWRLGEKSVGYFHEMESGLAGRQPVSMLDERE